MARLFIDRDACMYKNNIVLGKNLVYKYSGTSLIPNLNYLAAQIIWHWSGGYSNLINTHTRCMIKLHALQYMVSSSTSIYSAKCSSHLDSKLVILDTLKGGTAQEKLATEYGIGRSTIGDI